jgi:hypothetical protein
MDRSPLRCALLTLLAGVGWAAVDACSLSTDRTVDCSSLDSIVADVIRLSGATTNDEKGIALYGYLHQVLFHSAYACEKRPQTVGPLKVINVYGWGLCGGEHTVMKALFETAGWQVRYRGWSEPGHTTVEARYDGRWHYFDVFLKAYFWTKDRSTIAGQDDITADPRIVLDGLADRRVPSESYLCCGDDAAGIVSGCRSSHAEPISRPADGWASVTGRDEGYSPLLTLRCGTTLTLGWQAQPGMMVGDSTSGQHSCPNMKDIRANAVLGPILEHYGTRTYANGRLLYAPDFAKPGDVADIALSGASAGAGALNAHGSASALFTLDSPYPYAAATLAAASSGGACSFALSSDGGASWTPCVPGDLTALVRQRYAVVLKATFSGSLTALTVDAVVEHNRGALPFLYQGANVVTVGRHAGQLPAGEALEVTYAFQEANAPAHRSSFNGSEVTYGEARTVTKQVTALPCTFTIDVGGNTPPRMVSIARALKALTAGGR